MRKDESPAITGKKSKARSVSEKAGIRSRTTGRRPDTRVARKGRVPLTRDVVAKVEKDHQSRERRSREGREDAHEQPNAVPRVLVGIVGANVVVFILWQSTATRRFMGKNFAVSSAGVVREGRYHTLLSSIFSHYDPVPAKLAEKVIAEAQAANAEKG